MNRFDFLKSIVCVGLIPKDDLSSSLTEYRKYEMDSFIKLVNNINTKHFSVIPCLPNNVNSKITVVFTFIHEGLRIDFHAKSDEESRYIYDRVNMDKYSINGFVDWESTWGKILIS